MTTGWRWVDDLGQEFKSKMAAAHESVKRPESTFTFSELSMAGTQERDATDEIREFALLYVHDTFDQYVTDVAIGRRAGERVWPN